MAKRLAAGLLVAGLGLGGSAWATLISRGPDVVYDDVLDITWTRNANLPGSSGLTWTEANAWVADLVFAGYDDWRLPTMNTISPTATPFHCGFLTASECAATGNELGYMFFHNLLEPGPERTGTQTAIGGEVLTDIQPVYWSGTLATRVHAWDFHFDFALQQTALIDFEQLSVWAVRSGDVTASVAAPPTLALVLVGLGVLGWRSLRSLRDGGGGLQPPTVSDTGG